MFPAQPAVMAEQKEIVVYFFYIDESGNRDVKVNEPYVLAAVGMYEKQWFGFNKHLSGMKTNIARNHDPNIRQNQLEIKANLITKPSARKQNPFFKHLTDDEINYISDQYISQLEFSKMAVISVVVDKTMLEESITAKRMHEKAYEILLERIQHYIWNEHRRHKAIIIMDDAGANYNRGITLMHAHLLGRGNNNMDFRNIVEYPFFASSELSNGVQLADLVAYTMYYTFKHNKSDYSHLRKLLPRIARHDEDRNILAGLKVWPESKQYLTIFDEIQLIANQI